MVVTCRMFYRPWLVVLSAVAPVLLDVGCRDTHSDVIKEVLFDTVRVNARKSFYTKTDTNKYTGIKSDGAFVLSVSYPLFVAKYLSI